MVVETIVDGLSYQLLEDIGPDSNIVDPAFARNFRTRLQIHHATHEEVLKKKSFEFAFKAASVAAGRVAEMEPDATRPGYDVVVEGVRFSLKTEAGSRMSERSVKISKLMEARWIRECRTGVDFREGCKRILEHFKHYDRILLLRAFTVTTPFAGVRYDLLEIPLYYLELIRNLQAEDFSPRTEKNGSSSAVVRTDGVKRFKLRLDGSVEKVTVETLPVSVCRFHASWLVETLPGAGTDE
jgi:hypothetical protein